MDRPSSIVISHLGSNESYGDLILFQSASRKGASVRYHPRADGALTGQSKGVTKGFTGRSGCRTPNYLMITTLRSPWAARPPRVRRCRQRLRDGCRLLWFEHCGLAERNLRIFIAHLPMLFHRTPREFERFSRELKSPLPGNEIFKAEIKTPKRLRRFKGRRCRDKPYPSNPANSGINHREPGNPRWNESELRAKHAVAIEPVSRE